MSRFRSQYAIIVRLCIFFALCSLLLGAALFFGWFHVSPARPLFLPVPAPIVDAVRTSDEIERLRAGALQIAEMETKMAEAGNQVMDRAVTIASTWAMICGLQFVLLLVLFVRRRDTAGPPSTNAPSIGIDGA